MTLRYIRLWKKKTVGEYVIHPASKNDSPYFGKIVDQRMKEYEMFTSQKTRNTIMENNIELVAYDMGDAV